MRVLLPGIAGKLGRVVALALRERGHTVAGMDRRPWPEAPADIEMHPFDVRKRAAEDVFRKFRPEAVVHMATVTHLLTRSEEQFRVNLGSTRAVFDHSHQHGVGQVIFVGRHTFYGAAADAPLYHTEADAPLEVTSFPELADLVAADLYAASQLWRYPELQTSVLRFCYTLGPTRHGTLATFLSPPRIPTVLGFDPLFQFMHEHDVAEAICLALEKKARGVFNVAGPPPVPLSVIAKAVGRKPVPIPEAIFAFALGRFGLPSLPRGALKHIKYPVVVDDTAFRKLTGFRHSLDEEACARGFASFRS